MRHVSPERPGKCPACGSARVAEIIYGLPAFSPELEEALESGRTVLGGCCVTSDDPRWRCLECQTPIFDRQAGPRDDGPDFT
jgi:hypothetical protein